MGLERMVRCSPGLAASATPSPGMEGSERVADLDSV